MLEIGNGGMTTDEYRTHISPWAILAAPLLASNDLSKVTPENLAILENKDAIAIDQDALAQGIVSQPLGHMRCGVSHYRTDGRRSRSSIAASFCIP
jgi:hypothetical protein